MLVHIVEYGRTKGCFKDEAGRVYTPREFRAMYYSGELKKLDEKRGKGLYERACGKSKR